MIPVHQSIIDHDPAQGRYGDCFRACVASLFHCEIKEVPHFCSYGENWFTRLIEWCGVRGVVPFCFETNAPLEFPMWSIVTGKSPRYPDVNHSVVYFGPDLRHDPHPSGAGVQSVVDVIIFACKFPWLSTTS